MQRVMVIDSQKHPLMPCHPARARELLQKGKAAVFRRFPFTIILLNRVNGYTQPLEIKLDPGSRTTGVALVLQGQKGRRLVWAAHLEHRGHTIRNALEHRRAIRRGRRHRHLRYRAARFNNRKRLTNRLAPSLLSRVHNVISWSRRLKQYSPISSIAVETVRFDTQKLQNKNISSVEYQQGTLFGYEIREYLLEKFQRTCVYCDKQNIPLEIEHIIPKSKGGSNRVSNLSLSCRACNLKKGNLNLQDFLSHDVNRITRLLSQAKQPLKDAAAINSTRYAIGNQLKQFDLPLSFWSGGHTKLNRTQQKYPKDHWIDAACVGDTGAKVYLPKTSKPLIITATGRGSRQMCRVDRYGFPRTSAKTRKQVYGFKTGDLIRAAVTKGKKMGTYQGRVAVRSSGNFNVKNTGSTIQGIHYKYCKTLHRADGYNYNFGGGVSSSC